MADDTTSSSDERDPVDPDGVEPRTGDADRAKPVDSDADAQVADPQGEALASPLNDPGDYEISTDEYEAEELLEADETVDDTPDQGDPEDVVIDDADQLAEAESAAAAARSSRPTRRKPADKPAAEAGEKTSLAPKKTTTPRTRGEGDAVAKRERTTPGTFVNQSVGELRKVIWPTGDQLRQYFIVVLVFVLIIIAYVGLLDFAFGWVILKLFGSTPK